MSNDPLQQVDDRLTQINRHLDQIARVTSETGTQPLPVLRPSLFLAPGAHVPFSRSLLAVAGYLRRHLDSPRTLEELWSHLQSLQEQGKMPAGMSPTPEDVALSLDLLFAIRQLEIVDGNRFVARSTGLERETSQPEISVQQCRTDDRYRQVQERCDQPGNQLQELERRRGALTFRLGRVTNSLQQMPDMSLAGLHDLYHGLTDLFVPHALARLEEVEAFHQAMAADRQVRLESHKQEIQRELSDISRQQDTLQARRDDASNIVRVALHELLDCPSLQHTPPDADEVAHITTILSALWRAGRAGVS